MKTFIAITLIAVMAIAVTAEAGNERMYTNEASLKVLANFIKISDKIKNNPVKGNCMGFTCLSCIMRNTDHSTLDKLYSLFDYTREERIERRKHSISQPLTAEEKIWWVARRIHEEKVAKGYIHRKPRMEGINGIDTNTPALKT